MMRSITIILIKGSQQQQDLLIKITIKHLQLTDHNHLKNIIHHQTTNNLNKQINPNSSLLLNKISNNSKIFILLKILIVEYNLINIKSYNPSIS